MTCLDNATSTTITGDQFRASLDIFVILLIILGNSFIIFAVIRHWRRQGMPVGNKNSTYLVINLSVADALVGVFSIFYFLPRYLCSLSDELDHQFVPCILRFAMIIMAHLASGYTLIAIAVDRYIAVVHAVQYAELLTTRRISVIIGIIWLTALMGASLLFRWNHWDLYHRCVEGKILPITYTLVMGLLGQFIIMGIVSYVHWKIHRVALSIHNRNQHLTMAQKINTRSARALLIIIGVYTVTWSPFMVMLLIVQNSNIQIPHSVFELASSLVNVNYLVNPLIYAYNNRPVRKAISSALRMLKVKVPFNGRVTPTASVSKT